MVSLTDLGMFAELVLSVCCRAPCPAPNLLGTCICFAPPASQSYLKKMNFQLVLFPRPFPRKLRVVERRGKCCCILASGLLWDSAAPDVWMKCSGLEAIPTKLLCINGPLRVLPRGRVLWIMGLRVINNNLTGISVSRIPDGESFVPASPAPRLILTPRRFVLDAFDINP